MTIKEYAKSKGVSYEAIRKQIARYQKDLDGHIYRKNRTITLDAFAVDFLDGKRRESPIVVIAESEREHVQNLTDQIEALKNELIATQKTVISLQEEKQLMIEAKTKYDLLLEASHDKDQLIETLKGDLQEAKEATKEAKAEAESFRKSIFGFYRKISK